jgi:hypothetical protein
MLRNVFGSHVLSELLLLEDSQSVQIKISSLAVCRFNMSSEEKTFSFFRSFSTNMTQLKRLMYIAMVLHVMIRINWTVYCDDYQVIRNGIREMPLYP